jgi:hypothetical protein
MRTVKWTWALVGACVLAGMGWAQEPVQGKEGPQAEPARRGGPPQELPLFERHDADRDGVLTRDEVPERGQAWFDRLGKERITREEVEQYRAQMRGQGRAGQGRQAGQGQQNRQGRQSGQGQQRQQRQRAGQGQQGRRQAQGQAPQGRPQAQPPRGMQRGMRQGQAQRPGQQSRRMQPQRQAPPWGRRGAQQGPGARRGAVRPAPRPGVRQQVGRQQVQRMQVQRRAAARQGLQRLQREHPGLLRGLMRLQREDPERLGKLAERLEQRREAAPPPQRPQ